MRVVIAAATVCLAAVGLAQGQNAVASMKANTDIPAEGLGLALEQLARERGFQVVFRSEVVGTAKTQGAKGDLTTNEALSSLLRGTDLTYSYLDEKTVTIIPKSALQSGSAGEAAPDQLPSGSDNGGEKSGGFRVAQADQTSAGPPVEQKKKKETKEPIALQEVVVTGTHIRGQAPAGSAVTIYTREDIDQSGAASLDQFARDMTENFSGTDSIANDNSSAAYARTDAGAVDNAFSGATFNIHGIGPTATLTLLNGSRIAAGGSTGELTDISLIPLSAIDHIEVLTDGASAVYGADAVAGVVNIITRKDFNGSESSILYGAATEGGDAQYTASQVTGKSWGSGNALIAYEYQDQGGLDASQRDYIPLQGGPESLIPKNQRDSIYLTGDQDLWTGGDLSIQGLYSRRSFEIYQSEGPPGETCVGVCNSTAGPVSQYGFSAALGTDIVSGWQGTLSANWSRVDQQYNQNFTSGGIFSDAIDGNTDTSVTEVDGVVSGSIVSLPGGVLKTALGGSVRRDEYDQTALQLSPGSAPYAFGAGFYERHVRSAFAEVSVPIIGESNALAYTRRLELSAAGRYDDYSDFGSTTNPKLGISWEPVQGLDFRGTYGRSFRAPSLYELHEEVFSVAQQLDDPSSPTGETDTLGVSGGNPNLRPETSRSVTAGLDVKPGIDPDFAFSLTFFHVAFDNRIENPVGDQVESLTNPVLQPFITRDPPLSVVEGYFNSPGFAGDYGGPDYTAAGPAAVGAILDNQLTNVASTVTSGLDFSAKQMFLTNAGDFGVTIAGTRLLKNDFQATETVPVYSLLNTFSEPTAWKARGGVSYSEQGFFTSLNVNYVNSYTNDQFTPEQRIASWTTFDWYVAYKTGERPNVLESGWTVALSVLNLTDRNPPYVAADPNNFSYIPGYLPINFDAANASPVGRFISLQLSKRFGF